MLPVTRDVIVLCWDAATTADRRALEIAGLLGAEATAVVLSATVLSDAASIHQKIPACRCLIVDVETLASATEAMRTGVQGLRILTTAIAQHVLVYGFQPTSRHAAIVRALSSGALVAVKPPSDADAMFHIAENDRAWCRQLSGLSLKSERPGPRHGFVEGSGQESTQTMVRVGELPFFVRQDHGGAQIFFLAYGEFADLSTQVGGHLHLSTWFATLIPLVMFLRGALGDRVWHNDSPRACLTIDDPLLKSRHGFLEYRRLLESMRQRQFAMSLAFIPWNYRRSNDDVAALFLSSGGTLSLCVHGCDHTRGELATNDLELLRGKAELSLERMRTHHRLSGVPFDDVMVFPQGLFSAEAVAALKACDYLAAVNGDICPPGVPPLTLRDLLDVSVTRFDDFPLFGRRLTRHIEDLAFDLFIGRPALTVEHHTYFRNGYTRLKSFVARLNHLDERLEWTDLGTICSRACLTRTAEDGEVQVRFYTTRFSLTNRDDHTRRYLLIRRMPDGPPDSVTIDARDGSYECADAYLKIRLTLDAGQTAHIGLSAEGARAFYPAWRPSVSYDAAVSIRRHLCELRDNYVDTNAVLTAIVAKAVQVYRGGKQYLTSVFSTERLTTGPSSEPRP